MARMTAALRSPSSPSSRATALSFLVPAVVLALVPEPAAAFSPQTARTAQSASTEPPAPSGPVVVYAVRHAEKADNGTDDPPLALAGQIRVRILQGLLADAGVTHVHTTDWRRTRDTAGPIAETAGLETFVYDPGALDSLAQTIRGTPGRHLVVGHSNTTPALVSALGGDPSSPIHEMEYDRLYVVTILPGASPVVSLLRFGEPYVKGEDFSLRASRGPAGPKSLPREGN